MEMAQRNKLNRKIIRASLSRLFLAGDFFGGGGGGDKFEGATALLAQTNRGRAALWTSRGLWRKSFLVTVSFDEAARK